MAEDMCSSYEIPKKMKKEWSESYSNKAMQMMQRMGYEADKGLGKQNQGMLEPIVAVQQDGRKGFGSKQKVEQATVDKAWDFDMENITIPENVTWLKSNTDIVFNYSEMQSWIKIGNRKDTLDGETLFCEPQLLNKILDTKNTFELIDPMDFKRARSRSNPFETIRNSIFQNRAAVKMANIDSNLNFMFTDPKDAMGNSLVGNDELLYFADICAGPGGFSEYILYRKSWKAKGFGFTLRGENDFKLDKFFAGPPESFDPYYGVHDDGNIYSEENQDSFAAYIKKYCADGVHIVMADGGFSVEGQENIQEILSKQLYLCQCLLSLKILREKGNFLCKLFDIFTTFSVNLIFIMLMCFEEISIIKPNSSRPANSERYLVCKSKKSDTNEVCTYLNFVNNLLHTNPDDKDVLQIVSREIMFSNKEFIHYIRQSNKLIGEAQVLGLRKIIAFWENPQLKETRQSKIREQCLAIWKLPDMLRQAPDTKKTTEMFLEEFLGDWYTGRQWMDSQPIQMLQKHSLVKEIQSIYDWYFVPIGRNETSANSCSIFICPTRGKLLRYTDTKKWDPVQKGFEISARTIFLGEIVFEYNGEGGTQKQYSTLHIIDAIMLGGIDIRREPLQERIRMCAKYTKSINKSYKEGNLTFIRTKSLFTLSELPNFFNQMRYYTLKNNLQRYGIEVHESQAKFFIPGGILLLCELSPDFISQMSRKYSVVYYYHKQSMTSHYRARMPPAFKKCLYASFRNTFSRRLIWKWINTLQVEQNCKCDENILCRDDFEKFVSEKLSS